MKKIFISIIILIFIIVGYFIYQNNYQRPDGEETTETEIFSPQEQKSEVEIELAEPVAETPRQIKEISVAGVEFAFTPSLITVRAGERVRLTFINNGKYRHDLVFESLSYRTKLINPGDSDVIEFIAPAVGSYIYYCSVPGHRQAGMEGVLQVLP